MQSHVLPIPPCTCTAVSQTVRAARAQYALATRPAARASSGASWSTAHDAVERGAERSLHQAARLGEEVLHGLERSDRDAVLPALLRVGDRDVEHAPHEPDQIGARERQAQGRPGVEIGAREDAATGREPPSSGRAGRDRADRAREIGAVASRRRPAPARGGSRRPREPGRTPRSGPRAAQSTA